MANLNGLSSIVSELKTEKANLGNYLKQVDAALTVLSKLNRGSSNAKLSRTLSAEGRKRISLAQKKRWARVRAGKVVSIASKRGTRTLSSAGRRRIALAQKARWAKFRAKETA